jgi:hypothetical protein
LRLRARAKEVRPRPRGPLKVAMPTDSLIALDVDPPIQLVDASDATDAP